MPFLGWAGIWDLLWGSSSPGFGVSRDLGSALEKLQCHFWGLGSALLCAVAPVRRIWEALELPQWEWDKLRQQSLPGVPWGCRGGVTLPKVTPEAGAECGVTEQPFPP